MDKKCAQQQLMALCAYSPGLESETMLENIEGCLAAGADPTVADEGGWTPLHKAADANNVPAVMVLSRPELINRGDAGGWTPLHVAARRHGVVSQVCDILLSLGADPSAVTADGKTYLQVARPPSPKRAKVSAALSKR